MTCKQEQDETIKKKNHTNLFVGEKALTNAPKGSEKNDKKEK